MLTLKWVSEGDKNFPPSNQLWNNFSSSSNSLTIGILLLRVYPSLNMLTIEANKTTKASHYIQIHWLYQYQHLDPFLSQPFLRSHSSTNQTAIVSVIKLLCETFNDFLSMIACELFKLIHFRIIEPNEFDIAHHFFSFKILKFFLPSLHQFFPFCICFSVWLCIYFYTSDNIVSLDDTLNISGWICQPNSQESLGMQLGPMKTLSSVAVHCKDGMLVVSSSFWFNHKPASKK